jgi:uncharacterized membrane protein
MSNLSNAKLLGGIGALLSLIGWLLSTSFGSIVGIIGLIMVFIAIKNISDETKDKSIFDNYLYFFICSLIAIVAIAVIMVYSVFTTIDVFNPDQIQEMVEGITDFASFWEVFGNLVTGCIAALLIGWVLLIIGTLFLRRSFNSIAEHTKVDLFRTTGFVYFIGAITMIILIGFLIIIIAKIMEIIAFFSIPDNLPIKEKEIET